MFRCCLVPSQDELVYFDIPLRGEAIRLAYNVADIHFTDTKVTESDWATIKSKSPAGALPYLRTNGVKVGQSSAALTYVGMKGKLIPEDARGFAKVVETLFGIEEVFRLIVKYNEVPSTDDKKKIAKEALEKGIKNWGNELDTVVTKIKSHSGGYMFGESLTIADLQIFATVALLKSGDLAGVPKNIVDEFTNIIEIFEAVPSHPRVKAYYSPS